VEIYFTISYFLEALFTVSDFHSSSYQTTAFGNEV